jgi:Arc/MetJ family transcription regulator
MYAFESYHVHMAKRTTIELDEELLARAKRALGLDTTRATVEEALRQVAEQAETNEAHRSHRQRAYLAALSSHVDVDVLRSEQMWR